MKVQEVRPGTRARLRLCHWSTSMSRAWSCSADHEATSMAAVPRAALPAGLDPAVAGAPHAPSARTAPSAAAGILAGAAAMVFVGGSVAVSALLSGAPLFTAQAFRYTVASVLLLGFARVLHRRVVAPRGAEWAWLLGVAVTGLVVFNIALVNGSRHAEPAVLGVAVACVPLILAVVGPLLERRRPSPVVLVAALVVTCEAGFTLLAVPVLVRHGPWGVSVHATWLAAVAFAVLGVVHEGPAAAARLGLQDVLAVSYLAVAVTAVAFVLWYSSVGSLGTGRAGLLTGVAPVSAAASGVALGAPTPRPLVWVGIVVVAGGLALGLPASRARAHQRPVPLTEQPPTRKA